MHVFFVEVRRDGPDRPRTLLRLADLHHGCWCRALSVNVPHGAVTLSLSQWFCASCCGEQAAFVKCQSRVRHFYGVLTLPYKITCAGRGIAAHALCPAGRGPALSLVLGVAGCNSRAGLVRFTPAQADYELGHGRNEVVRLAL